MKIIIKLSLLLIVSCISFISCSDDQDEGANNNSYYDVVFTVGGVNELSATVNGNGVSENASVRVAPPRVIITNVIPGEAEVIFNDVQLNALEEDGEATFTLSRNINETEISIDGIMKSNPNTLTLSVTTK